jgi:hypothetical protein
MYAQTQQLPVSCEQIDGSTFNNNLPHGNDVWPQLNLPQTVDKQISSMIVATFRMLAQSRAAKSAIHCFAYNLLAQNRFNNQLMQEWCQRAVDFGEYLAMVQRAQPNEVIDKAATKIYLSLLFVTASNYPAVAQRCPAEIINGLQQVGQEFQAIQHDVMVYQRNRSTMMPMGGMQQMGYAGAPQGGVVMQGQQLPPINSQLSQYAVGQQVNLGNTLMPNPPTPTPTGGTGTRGSALYIGDQPAAPIQPQSWTAGQPLNASVAQPTPQPAPITPVGTGVQDDPDLVPPSSVDDIIMDPYAYTPKGFLVDVERKFDVIHAPGGVEIRPAYQTKWKRTVGDDQPYSVLYDPNRFVLFYVKWPDGAVKEKLVEVTEDMKYIQHELNDQLRARAIKPEGRVVASTRGIIDNDKPPVAIEEAVTQDHALDDRTERNPVVLDALFTNSTDLENEHEARQAVIEALELDETESIPAHEYTTVRFHALDISEECFEALDGIKAYKTLGMAANKLKSLLDNGVLPLRYYRFINDRLTEQVNTFLSDNLSLTGIRITDFVADIDELGPYLATKRGKAIQTVFESAADLILARSLNLAQEDNGDGTAYGVVDYAVNFQLSWAEADLISLNIEKEPVLVSNSSHPKVLQVVKDMLKRAIASGTVGHRRMRLITIDGVYLEVVRGMLVENAILLKRL